MVTNTPLTRRRALAGAAASAALLGMGRRAFAADVDVLIVGAGAAGLSAARECERLKLTFRLVEARDRIGGRAFTDQTLGAPFDAGAEIIHFADRNPWVAIAESLQRPLNREGWRFGSWQVYAQGRPLGVLERGRRWQAFREMEARMGRAAARGQDISLADAVADLEPDQRAIARSGLLLVLGEDGERISILDNESLWSGPDYTTRDGYGALVAAYGRGLPVELDTAVTAIDWSGPLVAVTTARGTLRAGRVIITVPVGVLRAEMIRFTPALPAATLAAIDGLAMGALTKILLRYEGTRLGVSPESTYSDVSQPENPMNFEFWSWQRPLVQANLGGAHARRVIALGEEGAVRYAAERLARLVGPEATTRLAGGRLAGWWGETYSRGSYSIARPGQAGARVALGQQVGDRLWFAGEASAGGAACTVGGATLEGRRAARDILSQKRG
jgi:monoamine oxidase